MSGYKLHPVAVVVGDSKICVFASVFRDEVCPPSSFEIFDTKNRSWTMVDRMMCSPSCVISQGDLHKEITFKGLTEWESLTRIPEGALWFDDKSNGVCMLRTGFTWNTNIPNLLVDIVKLDDEAFGSDLSKWKEIQSNKYFTFALTSCPCDGISVTGCFPISRSNSQ